MTRMEQVKALREAADSLEAAQRCRNHLGALLSYWETMSDEERREALITALDRMDAFVEVHA